jgi:hypothetical protein
MCLFMVVAGLADHDNVYNYDRARNLGVQMAQYNKTQLPLCSYSQFPPVSTRSRYVNPSRWVSRVCADHNTGFQLLCRSCIAVVEQREANFLCFCPQSLLSVVLQSHPLGIMRLACPVSFVLLSLATISTRLPV